MNVQELYQNLSYGALSNLAMSNSGSGDIVEARRPSVILAANEALLRLYSRFTLKEKDCVIRMVDGVTNYHLRKRFAIWTRPQVEKTPYILDMPLEPFEEDVIKITSVFDSSGHSLPLNDDDQSFAVFTPQADILQVPRPILGGALSIVYQARHEKLDHTKLEQPIEVPDVLEGAFLSYTAFKIFSSMGTAEATAKAMEHNENYEAICTEVVDRELITVSISSLVRKFEKRGYP
jgi:hypothetical protein